MMTRNDRALQRTHSAVFSLILAAMVFTSVACTQDEPAAAPRVQEISAEVLMSTEPGDARIAEALILDVRTPGEYQAGHVPKAINIPHDQLAARLGELDVEVDEPIVVYCKSGARAGMAASVLLDAGYSQILHLEGDMTAWHANGHPVE